MSGYERASFYKNLTPVTRVRILPGPLRPRRLAVQDAGLLKTARSLSALKHNMTLSGGYSGASFCFFNLWVAGSSPAIPALDGDVAQLVEQKTA